MLIDFADYYSDPSWLPQFYHWRISLAKHSYIVWSRIISTCSGECVIPKIITLNFNSCSYLENGIHEMERNGMEWNGPSNFMGWDRGWVMAFPLVPLLFWGVEYDKPSLNPFCFSEKIFCFLLTLGICGLERSCWPLQWGCAHTQVSQFLWLGDWMWEWVIEFCRILSTL